jgi:acyl-CoA thioester hydrolase
MRTASSRNSYVHFTKISTRWMDNDVYGHINNAVYYSFFDTAVNEHLVLSGCLDAANSPVIGLVVATSCQYFKPISFPAAVHAGLRVAKLGTSSVRYEIGLFPNGEESAAAEGDFVHVYVDRATNKPVPVPDKFRIALSALMPVSPGAGS